MNSANTPQDQDATNKAPILQRLAPGAKREPTVTKQQIDEALSLGRRNLAAAQAARRFASTPTSKLRYS